MSLLIENGQIERIRNGGCMKSVDVDENKNKLENDMGA